MYAIVKANHLPGDHNPEGIHGRALTWLIKHGYVVCSGSRICSESHVECGLYTATPHTGAPLKVPKNPTKKQKKNAGRLLSALMKQAMAAGYKPHNDEMEVLNWLLRF
jgi:hypothetical protein